MARRQRVDTVAGAVAVATAVRRIDPPADVHLVKGAREHFDRAIAARPAVVWNDEAVAYAASYANHMALLLRLQREIDRLSLSDPDCKELRTSLNGVASMAKQARQSLGLHDRGQNGEKRDSEKRDQFARGIEGGLGGDEMGLLN